jgi:uncharacterized membrane protein
MTESPVDRALESDAPITAAVHQKAISDDIAEAKSWHEAAMVGRTVTINRPRHELFAFWRDFRNLPRFMENIESVEVRDDRRSHWRIASPGGTVEWDAVLTEEVEDELLAWESEPGADIKNAGRIEFLDAPGGRGTQVRAVIVYDPPAGDVGKLIAKLFQKEPKVQARRELRRFKQLMETGEISVSTAPDAAPRGGSFAKG